MQKLITAALITSISLANNPAFAQDTSRVSNYIGVSTSSRINDSSVLSVSGKYKLPIAATDLSVRPELTLNGAGLVGVGASLTLDTKVPVGTLYSGFGVSVEQLFPTTNTKAFGVIGVESKLSDVYSAYGSVKLPFSSVSGAYNPTVTVGLGYSI